MATFTSISSQLLKENNTVLSHKKNKESSSVSINNKTVRYYYDNVLEIFYRLWENVVTTYTAIYPCCMTLLSLNLQSSSMLWSNRLFYWSLVFASRISYSDYRDWSSCDEKSILISIDLQKVFDIGADYTSNYGILRIHGGIGKNKE